MLCHSMSPSVSQIYGIQSQELLNHSLEIFEAVGIDIFSHIQRVCTVGLRFERKRKREREATF